MLDSLLLYGWYLPLLLAFGAWATVSLFRLDPLVRLDGHGHGRAEDAGSDPDQAA